MVLLWEAAGVEPDRVLRALTVRAGLQLPHGTRRIRGDLETPNSPRAIFATTASAASSPMDAQRSSTPAISGNLGRYPMSENPIFDGMG